MTATRKMSASDVHTHGTAKYKFAVRSEGRVTTVHLRLWFVDDELVTLKGGLDTDVWGPQIAAVVQDWTEPSKSPHLRRPVSRPDTPHLSRPITRTLRRLSYSAGFYYKFKIPDRCKKLSSDPSIQARPRTRTYSGGGGGGGVGGCGFLQFRDG